MGIEQTIQRFTVQTAVYWAPGTPDGYGGRNWVAPVEIACRWEDKAIRITEPNGEEIISRAKILVTQDVLEQGMLYLGTLADLSPSEEADPKTVDKAFTIRRFDKLPMVKKTDEFVRTAYL